MIIDPADLSPAERRLVEALLGVAAEQVNPAVDVEDQLRRGASDPAEPVDPSALASVIAVVSMLQAVPGPDGVIALLGAGYADALVRAIAAESVPATDTSAVEVLIAELVAGLTALTTRDGLTVADMSAFDNLVVAIAGAYPEVVDRYLRALDASTASAVETLLAT